MVWAYLGSKKYDASVEVAIVTQKFSSLYNDQKLGALKWVETIKRCLGER